MKNLILKTGLLNNLDTELIGNGGNSRLDIMLDISTGEVWADEWHSHEQNSWKEYNDNNVFRVGKATNSILEDEDGLDPEGKCDWQIEIFARKDVVEYPYENVLMSGDYYNDSYNIDNVLETIRELYFADYYCLDYGKVADSNGTLYSYEEEKEYYLDLEKALKALARIDLSPLEFAAVAVYKNGEYEGQEEERYGKEAKKIIKRLRREGETFGDFLKEARNGKGFTQLECATLIDCPKNTFQKWEYNQQKPNGAYTVKLIKLLDLDPETAKNLLEDE